MAKIRLNFFTKRHFWPVCVFAFFTIFLTSCESSDVADLRGRYQGIHADLFGTQQVVAQLSDFKKKDQGQELTINVFQVLGSSEGETFRLFAKDGKSLELTVPESFGSTFQLKLKDKCASGPSQSIDATAKICWGNGKVDLLIQDKLNPKPILSLALTRDDSLPPPSPGKAKDYNLDEIMGRAKFMNYTVSQEAERVYQAKQNIGVARGNLLPKLNFRSILGIITGDFFSAIGSVLPFLFPSNWYRFEASKHQFAAEKSSFASLRGNEMNTVEGLYYLILRDQAVLTLVKKHLQWMKETKAGLEVEESVGALANGTAEYYGTAIALLERDRITLENFVRNQYAQLAHAVALPPLSGISGLAEIALPTLNEIPSIDPRDFYKLAQERSYEIKTLGSLLEAAKTIPGEIFFSFLDPDGSGGLGFGTASQLRIAKSQQNEISKKTDETYSLLELRSGSVAYEYNQTLENFSNSSAALKATERQFSRLINAHLLGDDSMVEQEFVNQITDFQMKMLGYQAEMLSSSQVFLTAKSKLDRLLLTGYYKTLEDALPVEPEKIKKPNDDNNDF